jgi:hypothetical protein
MSGMTMMIMIISGLRFPCAGMMMMKRMRMMMMRMTADRFLEGGGKQIMKMMTMMNIMTVMKMMTMRKMTAMTEEAEGRAEGLLPCRVQRFVRLRARAVNRAGRAEEETAGHHGIMMMEDNHGAGILPLMEGAAVQVTDVLLLLMEGAAVLVTDVLLLLLMEEAIVQAAAVQIADVRPLQGAHAEAMEEAAAEAAAAAEAEAAGAAAAEAAMAAAGEVLQL